ncbi:MAG: KH domain-containing protein [Ignavibacteriales bacterium]|nr:KH domain-containing protein [Ignavibacteriales bacterium]
MKEFIEYIAKQLVDNPDGVMIDEKVDEDKRLLLTIRVSQMISAKLLASRARTAAAMRILLTAVAAKHGKRAALEILD